MWKIVREFARLPLSRARTAGMNVGWGADFGMVIALEYRMSTMEDVGNVRDGFEVYLSC